MTDFNKDSLICAKCGSNNSEGSLFCSTCGATLAKEEVVNEVPVSSLICSKCGTDNSEGSLFCSNCGNTLTKEKVVNEVPVREAAYTKNTYNEHSSSTSYTDSELSLFLEKNQPYYMEKFKTMEKTADKKSWNWSAFLCHFYWMFYRKMYIEGIVFIVGNFILGLIPFIGWILNIAAWVCCGIFGNYFYYEHTKKKFVEISCLDSSMRDMLIQKKGGTNIILPIVLLVILVVIGIIFAIFITTSLSLLFNNSYY